MELAASKTVEGIGELLGLDRDQTDAVKLAVVEACINAFEHGRGSDDRVRIRFELGAERLTVQVSDRGAGFDVPGVRGALDRRHEQGERHRGWGLKIIEGLVDEVRIDAGPDGTTVTMVKRL